MNQPSQPLLALAGMNSAEIAAALNLKPFQGRQIFRWIHLKQEFDFSQMSDLSKQVRQQLQDQCTATSVSLLELQKSPRTGTKKALLALADGESVEAVLIRDEERVTLCLSSQVGCALKCDFCATGLAGFTRQLTPAEIVEQALYLLQGEDLKDRSPNIVYMGMGEPFRNYDNVIRSIRLLMDPAGLGIGARRITVSTVGEVGGIERFAEEDWQVRLSISLHGANDALRSRLVPLNRRFPLARLRAAVERYMNVKGRQITYEWTLLHEVNDSIEDARQLVEFIGDMKAFVNLIPWNPVLGLEYTPSTPQRCRAFRDYLEQRGVKATLRAEKGQDIDAACGQLRRTRGVQSGASSLT